MDDDDTLHLSAAEDFRSNKGPFGFGSLHPSLRLAQAHFAFLTGVGFGSLITFGLG